MKTVEVSAKTIDEAIKQAARELKTSTDNIEVEVLEEPSKGFLGIIGGKQARIRARIRKNQVDCIKSFLFSVFEQMGVKTRITTEEKDQYLLVYLTGGDLGSVIGRRGETLDALQYLTNLVAHRHSGEGKKIILDAEGYRKRREKTLNNLAHKLAERVKRNGKPIVLEPMNPQERRVIHTALQDDYQVQTMSEGEEPYRKVVISLRQNS